MDEWRDKVVQDITRLEVGQENIQKSQDEMRQDLHNLMLNDKLQDRDIADVRGVVGDIRDDTKWIRQKFLGAIITAAVAGVVGLLFTM